MSTRSTLPRDLTPGMCVTAGEAGGIPAERELEGTGSRTLRGSPSAWPPPAASLVTRPKRGSSGAIRDAAGEGRQSQASRWQVEHGSPSPGPGSEGTAACQAAACQVAACQACQARSRRARGGEGCGTVGVAAVPGCWEFAPLLLLSAQTIIYACTGINQRVWWLQVFGERCRREDEGLDTGIWWHLWDGGCHPGWACPWQGAACSPNDKDGTLLRALRRLPPLPASLSSCFPAAGIVQAPLPSRPSLSLPPGTEK